MDTNDAFYLERWIAHRDPEAFRGIVQRYAAMVYATSKRVVGNPADAEDVSQECFQALATAKRPPSAYLGPWLHRVATNIALNRRRSDGRSRAREDRFANASPVATQPEWNDVYRFVDEEVALLPEELRIPIVAYYLEGKSQPEIAAAIGTTRQTIANRMQRGIEMVRNGLAKKGIEVTSFALAGMFLAALPQAAAAAVPPTLVATLGKVALSGAGKNVAVAASGWALSGEALKIAAGGAIALALVAVGLVASKTADAGPAKEVAQQSSASNAAALVSAIEAQRAAPVKPLAAEPVNARPAFVATAPPAGEVTAEKSGTTIQPKSVQQVLDAYASYQKKLSRIAFQYQATTNWNLFYPRGSQWEFMNGTWTTYEGGELSTDGARLHLNMATWGATGVPIQNRSESNAVRRVVGFDAQRNFQWDGESLAPGSGSGVYASTGAPIGETLSGAPSHGRFYGIWSMHAGTHALGYITMEGRRIDQILREAQDKSMREEIDGDNRYLVIDADTPYGAFSVWFDPEHGFNVAHMSQTTGEGDVLRKGATRGQPRGYSGQYDYAVTEFEEIDGLWTVKSYSFVTDEKQVLVGYKHHREMNYVRNATLLNPDFDGLGTFAFMRGVPEAAECRELTFVGDKVTEDSLRRWVGGQLVSKRAYDTGQN